MDAIIRPENDADIAAISDVNRLAFGREDEARLVEQLRRQGYARLSLVAEIEGRVVGHVLFSAVHIVDGSGSTTALALAPLAVIPACQRQGLGATRPARPGSGIGGRTSHRRRGGRSALLIVASVLPPSRRGASTRPMRARRSWRLSWPPARSMACMASSNIHRLLRRFERSGRRTLLLSAVTNGYDGMVIRLSAPHRLPTKRMTNIEPSLRLPAEPLPDNLTSVQPGGGFCYRVELAWGGWRRWYLKAFRPRLRAPHGGVAHRLERRCAARNSGSARLEVLPQPVRLRLAHGARSVRWRERLPFARWGLAELQLMGYPLLALAVVAGLVCIGGWRSCRRCCWRSCCTFFAIRRGACPAEPGLLVSPADGTVAEVTRLEHDDFIGGPAVRIGIFLSIFNVHINRAPADARVIRLRYSPGAVSQRPESRERDHATKTCGSAWRRTTRRIGGWSCGRSPA